MGVKRKVSPGQRPCIHSCNGVVKSAMDTIKTEGVTNLSLDISGK